LNLSDIHQNPTFCISLQAPATTFNKLQIAAAKITKRTANRWGQTVLGFTTSRVAFLLGS
jgi:hypothetical protein